VLEAEHVEVETGKGSDALDRRPQLVAALQAAKARGVRLGNRTNLDETRRRGIEARVVQAERHAQHTLPLIREAQASGARSLAEIADVLNARGVPTSRGGSWAPTTVKRILDRG
jgi:hypothetical protein